MDVNAPGATAGRTIWIERLTLIVVAGLYLWCFTPDRPNGDGWIYIREIDAGTPVWNPNHLLFQPIGLAFAKLAAALGLGWSTFMALKVLAGLAAIAAVLIFHATLRAAGATSAAVRVAASFAFFFSGYFLSLALAEEFFIIQMPVLAGILLAAVRWLERRTTAPLVAMGALLAVVTGIQVNHVVLAGLLGLWVAWESREAGSGPWTSLAAVWVPGLLVGLPLILVPYLLSSSDQGLMTWLSSYQGKGGNDLGALYGLRLTPGGLVKSAATLVYGFVQSFAGLGDLGTAAEAVAVGRGFDFTPNVSLLVSTIVLFVLLGMGALGLLWWWWREGRRRPVGRLAAVWVAAYVIFNFLWVDSADQFWAPALPAMWLMIVEWVRGVRASSPTAVRRPATMLAAAAVLLATVNTGTVALYRSYTNFEANHAALMKVLRPGDLLITTGWDDIGWLAWEDSLPYERLTLVPLALRGRANSADMARLPERVSAHLASGRRVLVARVFEPDREARPWEQLARLGWPRARVVGLLGAFTQRPLAQVGTVRIHELHAKTGS